jgi:alpha-1,2-mannosyltransferase
MVLRWIHNWPLAMIVQAAFSGGAIAMVAVAAWRRTPTRYLALLTSTATFLLLPYSFSYDLTVVAIGALAILADEKTPPLEHRLALYGFLAPQLGIILAAFDLPGLPLMLAGLAMAQFRLWVPPRKLAPAMPCLG